MIAFESKIIEILEKYCDFEELTEDNCYHQVSIPLQENREALQLFETKGEKNNIIKVACGCTKMCLFPKDSDYVIKIPFCGREDGYTGEEIEFDIENILLKDLNNSWDHCEYEALIYEYFKDTEYEQFFVPIVQIATIHDHPIYIQKKVETFFKKETNSKSALSPQERNSIAASCRRNNVTCFNAIWIKDFISYYSEETLKLLGEAIEKANISDLHNDNIGYLGEKPVLLDYAGYHAGGSY